MGVVVILSELNGNGSGIMSFSSPGGSTLVCGAGRGLQCLAALVVFDVVVHLVRCRHYDSVHYKLAAHCVWGLRCSRVLCGTSQKLRSLEQLWLDNVLDITIDWCLCRTNSDHLVMMVHCLDHWRSRPIWASTDMSPSPVRPQFLLVTAFLCGWSVGLEFPARQFAESNYCQEQF